MLSVNNALVGSAQAGDAQLGWATDDQLPSFLVEGSVRLAVTVPAVTSTVLPSDYSALLGYGCAGKACLGVAFDHDDRLLTVAGEINVSITLPPPQGWLVAGDVAVSIEIDGAIAYEGAISCNGVITASFAPSEFPHFSVPGEVVTEFLKSAGQPASCISPGDVPAATRAPNSAF